MTTTMRLVLAANVDQAVKGLDQVGKKMGMVSRREKILAGGLLALGASVIYATKKTVDYGDWLEKTAQKTGVSVQALAAYKHSAELAGTSQEGLVSGLQRLQKNMGAATRSPTSASAEAFKNLGVAFEDAAGNARNIEDILPEMADRMAALEDGTLKTQIAMDLMGRQGAELIPLLNSGAAGLAEMAKEAEALGIVWSTAAAKDAAALNDEILRMEHMLDGMVMTATQYWLPKMLGVAEGINGMAHAIAGTSADTDREARRVQEEYTASLESRLALLQEVKDAEAGVAAAMEAYDPGTQGRAEAKRAAIAAAAGADAGGVYAEQFFDAFAVPAEHWDPGQWLVPSQGDWHQFVDEGEATWGELPEAFWTRFNQESSSAVYLTSKDIQGAFETIDFSAVESEFERLSSKLHDWKVEIGEIAAEVEEVETSAERRARERRSADRRRRRLQAAAAYAARMAQAKSAIDAATASTLQLVRATELIGKQGAAGSWLELKHALEDAEAEYLKIQELAKGDASKLDQAATAYRERQEALVAMTVAEVEEYRRMEESKTEITETEIGTRRDLYAEYQESQVQAYQAGLQGAAEFAGAISTVISAFGDERNAETRAALKAMFVVQQAAALAEAIIAMSVAIAQANASAPYPYNIPAIVAASVTGGAAIGTITATTIAGLADAGLYGSQLRAAGLNQHSLVAMRNDEVIVDPTGTSHLTEMLAMQKANMGRGQEVVVNTTLELDGDVLGSTVDSHLVRSHERAIPYTDRIRYGVR